jgi:2-C-methyl-D-erythritol 4-phosphate cytidylyltransferase
MIVALITAGGKGERLQQDIPKQFLHIESKPLIVYTLEAFQQHPSIDAILTVCLEGWHDILRAYAKQYNIQKLKWIVSGGKTGHDSIHNGIVELKKYCMNDDIVVIHDGNRALVSQDIISDAISVYAQYGSAVAVIPCTEVVFRSKNGTVASEEICREQLLRTQTPHAFSLGKLSWAHEEAPKKNIISPPATCSLMHLLGVPVYFSRGSEKNLKITTIDDIDIFRALLKLSDNAGIKR